MTISSVITLLVAVVGLIIAVVALRRAPIESREKQLERKVHELEGTVNTLLLQLTEARHEIETLRSQVVKQQVRITELETRSSVGKDDMPYDGSLLVAIGDDPMLNVDQVALSGVEERTGMVLDVLNPVNFRDMKEMLDTARMDGHPIRNVHMAMHMNDDGALMKDKMVTYKELSDALSGTKVLVLMGCRSSSFGRILKVVPARVAFRAEVDNSEAWKFSFVFWERIARGDLVAEAFRYARSVSPTAIRQAAELQL